MKSKHSSGSEDQHTHTLKNHKNRRFWPASVRGGVIGGEFDAAGMEKLQLGSSGLQEVSEQVICRESLRPPAVGRCPAARRLTHLTAPAIES